ncbi:MAG: hypothetical protein L3J93_02225 [Thermoplasmata archaeon]|nr:hypothetical protein [Thermoplasmata archaeon]
MLGGMGAPDSSIPSNLSPQPPGPSIVSSPPGGLRIRVRTLAAIVAVLVVLAALWGLYAAGVGPFQRGISHPNGPITYDQARAVGDPTAQGYSSGGWELIAAGGILVPVASTVPIPAVQSVNVSTFGSCIFHRVTSQTSLTLPAFHGSAAAGISPAWGLVYRNSSNALLVVGVFNGSAEPLAVLPSGSLCSTGVSFLGTLSGSVVDSPVVASRAAASVGGAAFLAAHPNASIALSILAGFSVSYFGYGYSTPTVWSVNYSVCGSLGSAGLVEPTFNATVDAATGQVTSSHSGTMTCPSVQSVAGSGLIVLTTPDGSGSPTAPGRS